MGLKAELRKLVIEWRDRGKHCRHGAYELCADELEAIIGPTPENLPPLEITSEEFQKNTRYYIDQTSKRVVRIVNPAGLRISMGPVIDLDE